MTSIIVHTIKAGLNMWHRNKGCQNSNHHFKFKSDERNADSPDSYMRTDIKSIIGHGLHLYCTCGG